jgi:aminopeptidase N
MRYSLLLFWLALPLLLMAQREIPRLGQIDLQHYIFELALSDTTDVIEGQAYVQLKYKQQLEELALDLVAPRPDGSGMKVSQVLENGQPVPFRQTAEQLLIRPQAAFFQDSLYTYELHYRGRPADGLVISANKYNERTFFGDNWPNRAHHWLPCVDHPSDKASVEFIVTAPDHYQVVANGVLVEELNLDESTKLTHWREEAPIPMKVAVIGAAQFGVRRAGNVNGIPVSSWVFPGNREAGYRDYSQALEVLAFFIEAFGPYPYKKLANVQSKTRYGGMENASNIFYFENSVTGGQDHEDLIAHEVAHQWFGNSVSEQNWHHIWLSEGFATYGANLYIEHAYGRDAMAKRLITERQRVFQFASRTSRPVVDTTVTDWNRLLNANSYQKGGWVLHMLRRRLGEVDFWEGLRRYYARHRGGNALTQDFQAAMEEASGEALDDFFQQWIFQPGYPELEVGWSWAGGSSFKLEIQQVQDGIPFQFPLDVKALGPDGQEQQWTIPVKRVKEELELPCPFEPARILFDPDTWLLFTARLKRS